MFNRLIAHNGLPLKIQTQWTKNVYWDRRDPKLDELYSTEVNGWLVRINGKKYPRGNYDGDGELDWTYRYTPEEGQTLKGKWIAIGRALTSAGLRTNDIPQTLLKGQKRPFDWVEQQVMIEGFAG